MNTSTNIDIIKRNINIHLLTDGKVHCDERYINTYNLILQIIKSDKSIFRFDGERCGFYIDIDNNMDAIHTTLYGNEKHTLMSKQVVNELFVYVLNINENLWKWKPFQQ